MFSSLCITPSLLCSGLHYSGLKVILLYLKKKIQILELVVVQIFRLGWPAKKDYLYIPKSKKLLTPKYFCSYIF